MKEIFQEYGGILITVVAILAVILVITAVVGTDTSGYYRECVSDTGEKFYRPGEQKYRSADTIRRLHGTW
ncbi:MAG: hypothetical protein ACLROW_07810 [Roseburia faecis]